MEKYRELARAKLRGVLSGVFAEFTGLRLHVIWSPPPLLSWDFRVPLCRTALCKSLRVNPGMRPPCEELTEKHLEAALKSGKLGHSFTCPSGVRNFWLPVLVEDSHLGVVFFQVLTAHPEERTGEKRSGGSSVEAVKSPRIANRRSRLQDLTVGGFDRAANLLRLLVDDLVQTILAEARKEELEKLSRNVAVHERMEARLRNELHKVLPCIGQLGATAEGAGHRGQIVQRMIEYIHKDYGQPISLQQLADVLGMNRAYGLPFRSYLKELRLEKAQDLLGNPECRISDVAYTVGYSDPNRFRLDFKERTGLAPSAWRETFRPAESVESMTYPPSPVSSPLPGCVAPGE